jgi:hypothetical protein
MKDRDRLLAACRAEADGLRAAVAAASIRAETAVIRAEEAEQARAAIEQAFAEVVVERTAYPR